MINVSEIARQISKEITGRELHELDPLDDGALMLKVMTRAGEIRLEGIRAERAKPPVPRLFKPRDFSAPTREPGEEE